MLFKFSSVTEVTPVSSIVDRFFFQVAICAFTSLKTSFIEGVILLFLD